MEKIIFLDLDGVLNTERFQNKLQAQGMPRSDKYGLLFDSEAVVYLDQIIQKTNAKIVISSSWKFLGKSTLAKMWKERNLPGEIIDITPSANADEWLLSANLDSLEEMMQHPKSLEIETWLKLHSKAKISYVIIDDENIVSKSQSEFFVQTNPFLGLNEENAKEIINILNG
ncbi:hypothetical protein EDM00_07625 [Ornithobacterium rhinotracheale]|uniref:HAD domain-containing protein n=1 Tax=Ornithobacterium rhinotracheale TaxID=28251 RepID=UPI00129D19C2|nr:HAD domain-containing protein [Ornithobacterium rhinotracheale]MRI63857.1 hypothetical protein [Ornithobacterium rhinotracheale]